MYLLLWQLQNHPITQPSPPCSALHPCLPFAHIHSHVLLHWQNWRSILDMALTFLLLHNEAYSTFLFSNTSTRVWILSITYFSCCTFPLAAFPPPVWLLKLSLLHTPLIYTSTYCLHIGLPPCICLWLPGSSTHWETPKDWQKHPIYHVKTKQNQWCHLFQVWNFATGVIIS